jgi:decaprenylphospho-beta-D-ribofuranose 2-oxidase
MSERRTQSLHGWGRTTSSVATIGAAMSVAELSRLVHTAPAGGILARGLGRSYGDAAQNAGGLVVPPFQPARPVELDSSTGLVRVSAGTTIERLLHELLPLGRMLPVLPGTRYVTVGGAIAADVHGKNHHLDGSFGRWVRSLDLVDGEGTVRTLSADRTPDQFWATVGGMGLTGIITAATLDTVGVTSARMTVRTRRFADLDSLLDEMERSAASYHVAWVDAAAHAGFGRGVLDEAEHEHGPGQLTYRGSQHVSAPGLGVNLVRPAVTHAFNELWWRRAPRDQTRAVNAHSYFHPLDSVRAWPRLYGRAGLVQWQFVTPDSGRQLIEPVLRELVQHGCVPTLVVVKRFGPENPAPLSFPREGWTVAVDLAAGAPGLGGLLDRLDEEVAGSGGRVYLAKDSRLQPHHLEAMYPSLPSWRETRAVLDPRGVFTSDLGRRLGLSR